MEEDVSAHAEIGANALVDAMFPAVLAHPPHDGAAGQRRRQGGKQEGSRLPHAEQEAAGDERDADGDPAQDVLDALRAPEDALVQQVGVEAAVRRLVDVVREEEEHHEQRRRPDVGHERNEREAEAHRQEGGEHERAAAAHRRQERVAPRADDERHGEGEEPFRGEHGGDHRLGVREVREHRREVGGGRGDREREPEGSEAEQPDEGSPSCLHAVVAAAGDSPETTRETTVCSARATSSSPSGSWPSTQPVRISSIAPYTIQLASRGSRSSRNSPSR